MNVCVTENPKYSKVYDNLLSGDVHVIRNIDRTGWVPVMKMNDGNVYSLVSGAKIKNHLERDYYPCETKMSVVVL